MNKFLIAAFLLVPSFASAAEANPAENFKMLGDIALYVAPFLGLCLFGIAISQIYSYAKTGNQAVGLANTIFKMLAGILLTSSQWLFGLISASFMGSSGVDYYTVSEGRGSLAIDKIALQNIADSGLSSTAGVPMQTLETVLAFVAFFGLIMFLNGIFHLKNLGDGKHDDRDLAKALTRLIGGICCINLHWVACFLSSLLGVGMMCPA